VTDSATYSRYIALGDSMSIDLYPALDARDIDVAVALERVPAAGRVAPLGAASLLYRNSEERWPDDVGDDLSSFHPGIVLENFAEDGATIGDVFGDQMSQVTEGDDLALITLTVGSNDLLSAFGNRLRPAVLDAIVTDVAEAYDFLVDMLRSRLPNARLIVTTIYDPSDRTGLIPGVHDGVGPLPLRALDRLNDHIRALAIGTPRVLLGDVHAHFMGHGVSVPEEDRWYWRRSLVEPNAQGASEIRRVWLEALRSNDLY
jgi:lysophospholipase L1-like esterase